MAIAHDKEVLMREVINSFEQGRKDTKYDIIYIYHDGPKKVRQLTLSFGITQYGNMRKLIVNYVNAKGAYADKFKPYVDKITNSSLVDDNDFKTLMIQAARNDAVFRKCMDDVYDELYFNPAYKWFERNGFTTNLGMMVVLDSYIHSGSIPSWLLDRMDSSIPVGSLAKEKAWIKEYIKVRRSWLANHSNHILNGTVYRMDFMNVQIKNDNWDLNPPFTANDVKIV